MGQLIAPVLVSALGLSKTTALAVGSLLASAALQVVGAILTRPKASDVREDLRRPNELPSYRFVWGPGTRAPGSLWYVGEKSGVRYFGYLVNSVGSDTSDFVLRLDGRPVTLSGDPRATGTLQRGAATVAEGETQITITHGLGETPAVAGAYGADFAATVDLIGATTFRVTIPEAAPVGGTPILWVCHDDAPGAVATNAPFEGHLSVWIQDGTDAHPPTGILTANGDPTCGVAGPYAGTTLTANPVWHTDKALGLTMIWLAADLGDAKSRRDRWPSAIPQLDSEMGWTRVWDPRVEAQDPDDATTWTTSANQALCLLHCALHNPVAPYRRDAVWIEAFETAADVADQDVALRDGGTVKRWIVGGVQSFGGRELPDILGELAEAGGGDLFTSGGRLGYRAAAWVAPVMTLTSYLREGEPRFAADLDRTTAPQAVRAVYADPGAGWEDATFEPYVVTDDWGGGEDRVLTITLPLVSNPYVAMRLAKMQAERLKLGKSFSATFPPNPAADAIIGTPVALNLASTTWRNGTYRVTGKQGASFLQNPGGGVAMRVQLDLTQEAEAVYAWTPATDERDYAPIPVEILDLTLPLPTAIEGGFMVGGAGAGRRLQASFQAVGDVTTEPNNVFTPDSRISGYETQFRDTLDPEAPWIDGPAVSVPSGIGVGIATFLIQPTQQDRIYSVRVRSVGDGTISEWVPAGPFLDPSDLVDAAGGAETTQDINDVDWRVHSFAPVRTVLVDGDGNALVDGDGNAITLPTETSFAFVVTDPGPVLVTATGAGEAGQTGSIIAEVSAGSYTVTVGTGTGSSAALGLTATGGGPAGPDGSVVISYPLTGAVVDDSPGTPSPDP